MRSLLATMAGIGVLAVLLFGAPIIGQGVKNGLALCANVVIPSLFVFFCVCYWASASGLLFTLSGRLRRLFALLLGNGRQGGIALLMGILGGYPLGAASLKECFLAGAVTKKQAKQLALGVFFPSPAFAVSAVGVGLYQSAEAGLLLWSSACLPALVMTCFLGWLIKQPPMVNTRLRLRESNGFFGGLEQACSTMLHVCALVVLGRVALQLLDCFSLPSYARLIGSAVLEVTNGCAELKPYGLPLVAAAMGFGGVSTHLQMKGILGELMPAYPLYCGMRLVQAASAYGIARLLCLWFPRVVPTFGSGTPMVVTSPSYLPAAAVVITCFVFLGWFEHTSEKRSLKNEKPSIC